MAPVKAPSAVAEQLGFDQAFGKRGAIDGDEFARAPAGGVGVTRQLFLARAGLATNEDRHLARRRALDPPHDPRNRRIGGYELRGDFLRWRRLRCGAASNHRELTRVLDRRDKLASDLVFKALSFLAPALIDKRAEFRAKDVGEAAARRGRQTVQQDARGPVRCQYPALIVDGQQARAQRVQILAAIVEGDQDISAMMFAEQSILDLGRRHGDERLGMRLPGHAIRRRIQYSGQFAIGREDRRRDAGEIVVARKEVIAPMHDDRPLEMRRGAKAVGAADTLRPDSAGPDARCVRSIAEARVGDDVEQQTVGVGKGDHEIGAGDLLMQRVHLSQRETPHQRTTLLFLAKYGRADEFG